MVEMNKEEKGSGRCGPTEFVFVSVGGLVIGSL